MWLVGFGEWVAERSTGWRFRQNVFINTMPAEVHRGLRIAVTESERFPRPVPMVRYMLDFWFRSPKGEMEKGYDNAVNLLAAIDGAVDATLSDGSIMVLCSAGMPDWAGSDKDGSTEWVAEVEVDVQAGTRFRDGGEGRHTIASP